MLRTHPLATAYLEDLTRCEREVWHLREPWLAADPDASIFLGIPVHVIEGGTAECVSSGPAGIPREPTTCIGTFVVRLDGKLASLSRFHGACQQNI